MLFEFDSLNISCYCFLFFLPHIYRKEEDGRSSLELVAYRVQFFDTHL